MNDNFGIDVVLVTPKIPNNTGSIIRLCANTGARLHLVRPLAFVLDDKRLRRAGLDYHEFARVFVHDDWQACKQALAPDTHIMAMTTKQSSPFFDDKVYAQVALVFGAEDTGLPHDVRDDIIDKRRLPMLPDSRSLNLANSVSICVYEMWRRQGFGGDIGKSIGYDLL